MTRTTTLSLCLLCLFIIQLVFTNGADIDHDTEKLKSARLLIKKGQINEALEIFQDVSHSSHPEIASSAFNNIGIIYMNNEGDLEEALDACEKAVELNPANALAHNNLGIIYEMRGDREMSNFEKATDHFLQAHQHQHEKALSNLHRCVHKYGTVPSWHFAMINDEERNSQFNNAIKRAIEKTKRIKPLDSITVLDIGAGSGLLSMMAAREGVKNVYACERVSSIASIASQIIQQNGFQDSVHMINADSSQLEVGQDIPKAADIVLAEILDAGMIGEGMLIAITDAFERGLASKEAIVIPSSGKVFAQIIDSPVLFQKKKLGTVSGFDLSSFNVFHAIYHNYDVMELHGQENQFTQITSIQQVFDFSFSGTRTPLGRERTILFDVLNKGEFRHPAIVFWIELALGEEASINCSPYSEHKTCHWSQAVQYLDVESLRVDESTITVHAQHDEGRIWFSL